MSQIDHFLNKKSAIIGRNTLPFVGGKENYEITILSKNNNNLITESSLDGYQKIIVPLDKLVFHEGSNKYIYNLDDYIVVIIKQDMDKLK